MTVRLKQDIQMLEFSSSVCNSNGLEDWKIDVRG